MWQSSLQIKVVLGYYVISAIALCLSLFTLVELHLVEQRLESGQRVGDLLNSALEMRRFEKNYLLYRQGVDIQQINHYATEVGKILASPVQPPSLGREEVRQLQRIMEEYTSIIDNWFGMEQPDDTTENRIRTLGKAVVTAAEETSREEGRQVRRTLERHRLILLSSVIILISVVVMLGRVLSRMVVLPLKRMEESMAGVVSGQLTSLHIQSADREILSLTTAFNQVLYELELRQKHLVRSEKLAALGTMLSGVAHELNNPLSNISTSCQILEEEMDDGDLAFKKELVVQIDEQTRRARDIVRSLLDFARDREFCKTPVVLEGLLREVVRFSKGIIPARVRVSLGVPPDIVLLGDRHRLQQAFINLLKNAIEAIAGEGEVEIMALTHHAHALSMEDPLFAHGRYPRNLAWAEVRVRDTGSGIAPEHMPRIFDPFYTTKPVGKGSGLGLSLVFEVVEEHEGAVVVDSRWGQGTTFRLRLPVAPSPVGGGAT